MQKKSKELDLRLIDMNIIIEPQGDIRLDIPERTIFELSESMKEVGLIHAILLTEIDGKFEVVAGNRRWLAAKRLQWKTIRAEVRELTRVQVALIRANENLQREGLSPIEEGAVYVDLFDNHKLTIKMIADRMGKPATHVKDRMDLLRLDPEIQKAIHNNKIGVGVAKVLSKIEDKKDLYRYLELAIENGVTENVAKLWTEEYRKGLQYIDSGERDSRPLTEITREEKYYTMCQTCEGPMEYKDMRTLKVCATCLDLIVTVVNQGYFKEEGK